MTFYKLAVFGNPIAHSLSPQIHQQFAAQFGLALSYEKILAPLDGFVLAAQDFFAQGGLGCNITAPFKTEAFNFVEALSERAQQSGAVNTIKLQDGKLWGDNTDGTGLLKDLYAKNIVIENQQVIIVGAGGAARGILPALASAKPSSIILINRDVHKAASLVAQYDQKVPIVAATNLSQFLESSALLIDATSDFEIIKQSLESSFLPKTLAIYDLKYGHEKPTPLIHWANAQGLKAYDGLGMLIEQAAEAFYQWFGLRPNTKNIQLYS
ncbi:MAG: shikimate dehydrogenase [Gammaproteobacteria bacterium]|jgi:shikimate dehydrogenase|nr:shikimate dehydrogenase [Gammaproteobacteria bacterium]